jgi:hypothetical protein
VIVNIVLPQSDDCPWFSSESDSSDYMRFRGPKSISFELKMMDK